MFFPEAGLWFCASKLRKCPRISCWHSVTCRGRVELLMHVSLLLIWCMILCASLQSFLHISSFHPLTHSWSHTLWLDCTHLLYVCDWLQASSYPRYWSRDFRGEVNWSLLLLLQENEHLKQTKEGGVTICAWKWACLRCLLRTLTLAGWLPALPHPWPRMADTQQFFTGKLYVPVHMLKLPAEELLWSALPRMTQEEEADGGGRTEED